MTRTTKTKKAKGVKKREPLIRTKKSRAAIENFVKAGAAKASKSNDIETNRMSLVIPKTLHKRIKVYCAANDLIMNDDIIELLDHTYPELPGG